MRRLVYLDAALDDLAGILARLAQESGSRAVGRSFVEMLRQQCRKLASLPGLLGHPRQELRPDMRSFAVKGYVIFFRYGAGTLKVVNILEGHRDIAAYFRDDTIGSGQRRSSPHHSVPIHPGTLRRNTGSPCPPGASIGAAGPPAATGRSA